MQPHEYPFDTEHLTWIYSRIHLAGEAEQRAKNVVSDMERIGLAPKLNLLPLDDGLRIPFYTFSHSDFSIENLPKEVPDTLKAVGFGLNWGDLHVLSEVCELGRQIWGETWMLKFRDKLGHPPDHIATVEELWWLGRWYSPTDVKHEACLGKETRKTVDWSFATCGGQIVNLEVKLRPRDWKRVVDGQMYSVFHESFFEGIAEKFPKKHDAEFNLVGMTLLAPLDREAAEAARSFLDRNKTIDGIIYWSTGMADEVPVQFHLKPHACPAKVLFQMPKSNYRFTLILHPWMDREKRRASRLGTAEDFSLIDGIRRKVGRILLPSGGPK